MPGARDGIVGPEVLDFRGVLGLGDHEDDPFVEAAAPVCRGGVAGRHLGEFPSSLSRVNDGLAEPEERESTWNQCH